jgi:thiol-disulfide isomerase/thioredoxin
MPIKRTRRIVAVLAVVALAGSGCAASSGMVGRRDSTGDTRYVAGSGLVDRIPPAERGAPVDFRGPLLGDKGTFDLATVRGNVVVLNVWGSWCAPCRDEAPDLEAAWRRLRSKDVRFVGVNTKDTASGAKAFVKEFGITYPSVYDEMGERLLAFRDTLPAAAIPTTLVIDRKGRAAARVLGATGTSTLVGMVEDVLAEKA